MIVYNNLIEKDDSMTSILEEFVYGNVSPQTQFFRKDSKYGRAVELVVRLEQKLSDRLGVDDKDLFLRYVDAQGEVNQQTAAKNLIYGYKLGLIMASEAFVGMDDLYVGGEE